MAFPADNTVPSDAATDTSETLATMCGGQGQGSAFNDVKDHTEAVGIKLGPGSYTPARGKALMGTGGIDANGLATSIWDRHARKNLIANGTGRTSQRTSMPTADNSYAIDRMRILMENANGFTITQEASTLPAVPGPRSGFRFTVGSGNNGKGGGFWPVVVADMDDVAGGVVSLQAKAYSSNARLANVRIGLAQFTGTADAISGDPVSAWGADGTNPTLATNWSFVNTPASLALSATTWTQAYVENQTVSSSAKNLAVIAWNDARTTTAADFFIVTDIQLERGAVCTALERVSAMEEEIKCLEWLWVVNGALDGNGLQFCNGGAYGYFTSATAVVLNMPLPVPMRAVPTIVLGGTWVAANSANYTLSSIAVDAFVTTRKTLGLTATGSGGATTNTPCRLVGSTVNDRMNVVAEP